MARRPNRRQRADGPEGHREFGTARPRHKADARIDKAQQAWDEGRFDEAIWLYERALERQPTNAVLLVDVARAYALRFRYADAEQLVDRACRIHPDDANLQRMLGRTYVQLQQFDRAIACFRRSLDLEPDSPERARTLY
jgi:tetratricopeptide (TPR) repeat protein